MTTEKHDSGDTPLGWSDLGRYFIICSVLVTILEVTTHAALGDSLYSGAGLGLYWTLMGIPVFLALYLALRPRGHLIWRHLRFQRTESHWYATAIIGWIGLVGIFCYLVPSIGGKF